MRNVAAALKGQTRLSWSRISLSLLSLPFVALVFLFNYLPLFGWSYAFFNYKPGLPLFQQEFVGLRYIATLFTGRFFLQALRNTLALSFFGILVSWIPMALALFLSELRNRASMRILQTVMSLPNFVSWIIVYSVFFLFLSEGDGVLNVALQRLSILSTPMRVLRNPIVAWYFQTAVGLWKGAGWTAIIYLAAISGIDQELYQAAEIDGCGRWNKMLHVTVPGIMPTYIVILLISVGFMLSNGFEQYYVFQNQVVVDRIDVLDTYVYSTGIGNFRYAYATAVGIFKTVVSVALVFTVNWLSKITTGRVII